MKTRIKQLLSVLMVMTLVLSVNTTAFAANSTKVTEAIGFYEENDEIYQCTLTADDIMYGFMSQDEEDVELIVEWSAEDGYLYLGYFYMNTVNEAYDYYFCVLYDNNRYESTTALKYTGLVDLLDGATVADLSFTTTKNPEIVKMVWGDRSEQWYNLEATDTIELLAAMEEYFAVMEQ